MEHANISPESLPNQEREQKVRGTIDRLKSFTVRIFAELQEGKTDEAEAKRRLSILGEKTFEDLKEGWGTRGEFSPSLQKILESAATVGFDPGGPRQHVLNGADAFLREVKRFFIEYFLYKSQPISFSDFQTGAIDKSLREFKRRPSIDPNPTRILKIPDFEI